MTTIDDDINQQLKIIKIIGLSKTLNEKEGKLLADTRITLENLKKIKLFLNKHNMNDVNQTNELTTPLIAAVYENNLEIFDLLVEHARIDVNQQNTNGQTAAYSSASLGKINYLKKLSQKNADFQIKDKDGKTPLFISIANHFHRAASFIVFKITGYSIYPENDFGADPIHKACSLVDPTKSIETLKLLKNNNVNLNSRDNNNRTPLMTASEFGNLKAVQWLIENGADVNCTDRNDNTFLNFIPDNLKDECLELLQKNQMNDHFEEDVNRVKEYGHVLGIGSFLKLGNTLGLGGVVSVPFGKDGTVPVYTEAWDSQNSYMTIEKELENYTKREPLDNNLKKTYEAIKLLNEQTDNQPSAHVTHLYSAYAQNNPIILQASTPGHGTGLALYKDKLIFTDRFLFSGGRTHECTQIFDLKNKDEASIRKLIEELREPAESKEDLLESLSKVVDLKNPILYTGDKLQSHGTCTYSNPRSNIEGILCVMHADSLSPLAPSISKENIIKSKQVAHSHYRNFLYSSRHNKILELINDLNTSENNQDPRKADMYFDIAKSYIKGHSNPKKNDGNDWKNTLTLYQSLPPRHKELFIIENKSLAKKIEKSLLPIKINEIIESNDWENNRPLLKGMQLLLKALENQFKNHKQPDVFQAIRSAATEIKSGKLLSDFKKTLPAIMLLLKEKTILSAKFNFKKSNSKSSLKKGTQSQSAHDLQKNRNKTLVPTKKTILFLRNSEQPKHTEIKATKESPKPENAEPKKRKPNPD